MDKDHQPLSKKLRTEVTPVPIVPPPPPPEDNQVSVDPEVTTPNEKGSENERTPAFKLSQPRKLVIGSPEHRYAFSQPTIMPSNEKLPSGRVPSLSGGPLLPVSQKIGQEERGRRMKTYTQSPPKSPNRSPTRTLELIKLSPTKKSRMELQKLYDAQQAKISKKERLFIHQLVLNNFKSYAGSQIIGPFDPSFSAVVGPNGSGKSNVIDSMLFVFGFRANKMRQDRLSDLIHKSEEFPGLRSCSVEVHFRYATDKEGKDTEIIFDKELIVERRAFKNNSSKYYINGKESNYTEVTQMLRQEGIDLDHKRFLILQGEVDSGFNCTWVCPIIKGIPYYKAVKKLDIGGRFLNGLLKETLSFRHYNMMDETLLVNNIKEKCVFMSPVSYFDSFKNKEKTSLQYVLPDFQTSFIGYIHDKTKSTLPANAQTITLKDECFMIPETFFHPEMAKLLKPGIVETILESLSMLPEPLRPMMIGNIVCTGGNFNIPHFATRLTNELQGQLPMDWNCRVTAMKDENELTTWNAMSQFATTEAYVATRVTREEYWEHGVEWCTKNRFGYQNWI